jgi:hypothetical protein
VNSSLSNKRRISSFKLFLATLGGGDRNILIHADVDSTRLAGRGVAALIPALFGGAAVCIAFRYAFNMSMGATAAAGVVWGLIVLCFDLSLMTHGSDGGLLGKVVGFGLRAVVAVLAAYTFASPIVIWMFSKDVAVQVAQDEQNGLANYKKTVIQPKYAPKIAADNAAITSYRHQLTAAAQSVTSAQQAVQTAQTALVCEGEGVKGAAGCGNGTGKFGQGPVYQVRLTELNQAKANLATADAAQQSVDSQVTPELQNAQTDLASQQSAENTDDTAAANRYGQDDGLIARWKALDELEANSATVASRAYGLEALIIALDLSAVIARIVTRTPSYDQRVDLERDKLTLYAGGEREECAEEIDRRRITREAETTKHEMWTEAELEVEQHNVNQWVQSQTGSPWTNGSTPPGAYGAARARQSGQPGQTRASFGLMSAPVLSHLKGPSFSQYVKGSTPQSQVPFPLSPWLRRLAQLGAVLVGALSAVLAVLAVDGVSVTASWLVFAALLPVLAVAAVSHGFRIGPLWVHRAVFAAGLLGLVLPVAIIALNI